MGDLHEEIRVLALKRQRDFLANDELAKNSPFHFFDRATKVASPPSHSPSQSPVTVNVQQNNTQQVQNGKELRTEHLGRIAAALEITAEE